MNAATADKGRPLGPPDEVGGLRNCAARRRRAQIGRAHGPIVDGDLDDVLVPFGVEDVMGNDQGDRAGTRRRRDAIGRADELRQGRDRGHEPCLLRAALEEGQLVEALRGDPLFLQGQPVQRQFADDSDHWDRRVERFEKPGGQEIGAGTHRHVAHARSARQPGIGVGGVSGVALVAHEDVADAIGAARDAVVKGGGLAARHAEDELGALLRQHFCDEVADMGHCRCFP